jgi:hypothetical protein
MKIQMPREQLQIGLYRIIIFAVVVAFRADCTRARYNSAEGLAFSSVIRFHVYLHREKQEIELIKTSRSVLIVFRVL